MFNHLFRWGLNDESFQCAGSNVEVKGCETQNRALGKPLFEMCCVHMGQFLQGGKNGRLMSYSFLKVEPPCDQT